MLQRALNHMAAPQLNWREFLDLAASLKCVGVEFRNDLPTPLFMGADLIEVADHAANLNLRILALAEVKAFDDWSNQKAQVAIEIADIAVAIGAERISLIARNDDPNLNEETRRTNLRSAINGLLPIVAERGLIGLIEPLGFATCALRDKAEIADAIEECKAVDHFQIAHDTFHHALTGGEFVPELTGIVHISGATRPVAALKELLDSDRGLVTEDDRLGNLDQIQALVDAGYDGPFSFEPFSPGLHSIKTPLGELKTSFEFIEAGIYCNQSHEKQLREGLPA